jgi:hypothetical protein
MHENNVLGKLFIMKCMGSEQIWTKVLGVSFIQNGGYLSHSLCTRAVKSLATGAVKSTNPVLQTLQQFHAASPTARGLTAPSNSRRATHHRQAIKDYPLSPVGAAVPYTRGTVHHSPSDKGTFWQC